MTLQPQAYVRMTWKGVIEMRVLVSVDMEGIAGVVDGDDVIPGHSEYERNRKLLTAEASAAVRGVHPYEAGAQVLVTEAHARFRNLLPELLDRRAELLRGAPKPGGMMAGLADSIDAVALLHPDEACDRIEQAIPEALAGRGTVRPLRFDGPVRLEVRVHRPRMTEHALLVPGMELEDGCTLRYAAPDFPTAYQVIELIATLGAV
ncbi:M55 family metallopeptidase [Nonomuraea sp. NPDC049129]|uniref:M55 family metallopeptidase n=1 Tax=Nonomuraea sp. NPDC049129 TaxID=3155272 RepID=UPI003411E5C3